MKSHRLLFLFAAMTILIFQNCQTGGSNPDVNETSENKKSNGNKAIQQQLSSLENALGELVKNTYGDTAIGLDTSGTVLNLDTMQEEAQVRFRLNAVEETIKSINAQQFNKSTVKCTSVLIGTYSCNCTPPPNVSGGAVHCDLCGIYKIVCK